MLPHPRYRDYRNAGDYNFSEQFWVLLAIRLAFLILFEVGEDWGRGGGAALSSPPLGPPPLKPLVGRLHRPQHVALCIKLIAAWLVPDVPQMVKNKVLDEKYQRLLEKLRCGR